MTIVYPGAICEICQKELGQNYDSDEIIGLPEGVLLLTEFHSFNDAVIHQRCFQEWSKADEFVRVMNNLLKETNRGKFEITKEGKLKHIG